MSEPPFLTIEEWGGTPNGWPQMALPATDLWAHHSVTNEDLGVFATANAIADFLELDAIGRARGHGGISYSYAIHPEGVIGEGQGTRRGAHTAGIGCSGSPWGWNPCSYGVVFIGNYDEDTLTPAAIHGFRWLRDGFLIPRGLLVPGIYPTGGHQDARGNATGCPGIDVESKLDLLRLPYVAAPAQSQEDRMQPVLCATATGACFVYDPNTHQANHISTMAALEAVQALRAISGLSPALIRNDVTDALLADADKIGVPAGGPVVLDLSGLTISGTFSGTATPV